MRLMPTVNPHPHYIWQHPAWPQFTFDAAALAPALDQARLEQGRLLGLLGAIGLEQANTVQRELWVQEALASAARAIIATAARNMLCNLQCD